MSVEDDIKDLRRTLVELARNCEGLPVRIAQGGGGSSGSSGGALQLVILTADCDPATGDLGEITAVSAPAQAVAKAYVGSEIKITPIADSSLTVWNVDTGKSYDAGQAVWVSAENVGGYDYLEIVSANCSIYAEAPP